MVEGPFVPTFLRELPLARAALEYAAGLHQGQRRASDDAPFLLHPLEVAALLDASGYPESVISAALLHDTIEDAQASPDELRARFGSEVADLVGALTEDSKIEPFTERKAALRRQVAEFGANATAIYAADKVAKVRELRARAAHDPTAPRRTRPRAARPLPRDPPDARGARRRPPPGPLAPLRDRGATRVTARHELDDAHRRADPRERIDDPGLRQWQPGAA